MMVKKKKKKLSKEEWTKIPRELSHLALHQVVIPLL